MQCSLICVQQTINIKEKSGLLIPKVQFSLRIHVTSQEAFCDAFFSIHALLDCTVRVWGNGGQIQGYFLIWSGIDYLFLNSSVNFTVINHTAMQEQKRVRECSSYTKCAPNL